MSKSGLFEGLFNHTSMIFIMNIIFGFLSRIVDLSKAIKTSALSYTRYGMETNHNMVT